ncbi:MAG: D-amino-acid transaminase [Alphaproteobacteria bacterium]
MGRFAYVNGSYVEHYNASLSIDDRGLQFGDAVYEVYSYKDGKVMDDELHLNRLERSLNEIGIDMPMSRPAFKIIVSKLVKLNRLKTGLVYFQISRGTYPRDHVIPKQPLIPNIIITTKNMPIADNSKAVKPIKVISQDDIRWGRVDIKTVMLLPNCLAKTNGRDEGTGEIVFVKDGVVTESASSNFFFVDKDDNIITAPIDNILKGITRTTLFELAKQLKLNVIEREFTLVEAKQAKEAFVTSATQIVKPVYQIDDTKIGDGKNYPICEKLYDTYMAEVPKCTD